jgi:ABC-type transporter Mla subunit MlaD
MNEESRALARGVEEVRDELLAIRASLKDINETLPTLRSEVDERVQNALVKAERAVERANQVETRFKRNNRRITAALVVPLIALIALASLILWSTNETRQATEQVKQLASAINDCTQPTGKCFQENRKSLAVSIQQINDNTSAEIQKALERNHADQVKTQYLFCAALKNAELPMPVECDPILANPPADVAPK